MPDARSNTSGAKLCVPRMSTRLAVIACERRAEPLCGCAEPRSGRSRRGFCVRKLEQGALGLRLVAQPERTHAPSCDNRLDERAGALSRLAPAEEIVELARIAQPGV